LFRCGQAMFLCDIGQPEAAVAVLSGLYDIESVLKKWRYLKSKRPDLVVRYSPLFQYLESQGAL
jgi:hypothetical protein